MREQRKTTIWSLTKERENILDASAKVQRTYVTSATSVVSTNVEARCDEDLVMVATSRI